MNLGKILLGTLAGIAVGAIVGVLFAPDKGSVTRKKIAQKGEDYAEGLKEKFDEFVDSVFAKAKEVNEDIEEEIEEIGEQVKGKFKVKT